MPRTKTKIRLGVVQARARWGDDAPGMLTDALDYVDDAGKREVDLLLFPELYPGPVTHEVRYDVIQPLQVAARINRVAIAAGTSVAIPGTSGKYHTSHALINSTGVLKGYYHRTHPRGPVYRALYGSGGLVNFEYVAGDEIPVFDMGWGTVGISICSEMFVPEVARVLAIKGAEICLFPVGWTVDDLGWRDIWQTLVRARAIENIMYTAACQNLFDREVLRHYVGRDLPAADSAGLNRGLGIIAGPEGVIGIMPSEGILTADLDLERIRLMRRMPEFPDGLEIPPPFGSVPGVLGLRRPDLTARLLEAEAKTLPDLQSNIAPQVTGEARLRRYS